MTNDSSGRLDRIERTVEVISLAVQANTEQIGLINNALLQLANAQLQQGQAVENQKAEYRGFMIKTDALLARIDANSASINALLEQQKKILDYLQRDGGNGRSE